METICLLHVEVIRNGLWHPQVWSFEMYAWSYSVDWLQEFFFPQLFANFGFFRNLSGHQYQMRSARGSLTNLHLSPGHSGHYATPYNNLNRTNSGTNLHKEEENGELIDACTQCLMRGTISQTPKGIISQWSLKLLKNFFMSMLNRKYI